MSYTRRLVVPAQHDRLAQLAVFVGQAALEVGFEESMVNRIELAVDEACSNIIDHAYAGTIGNIQLDVNVDPQQSLQIVIVDNGKPFDPREVPAFEPCTSLDDIRIGGFGLHLMRQAMDDLCFEFRVPGVGNRLTMVKHI